MGPWGQAAPGPAVAGPRATGTARSDPRPHREPGRFGNRWPPPLCTSSCFNQVFFFFFFLYTGRQRGEISLFYYFYFSNLPRCATRPAARLPRAGARLSAVGALCPREPGSGGLQRGRLQGSCSGSFPALVLPPRPYPGRSRGRGGTLERIQPRAGAGSPGKGCVRAAMERAPRALDDWKPSRGLAPLPDAAGLRQPAFKPAPKIKRQCLFCRRGKL